METTHKYIKEKEFDNIITILVKMPHDEYLHIKTDIENIAEISNV